MIANRLNAFLLAAVGIALSLSPPLAIAADDKPMPRTPRVDLYGDPLPEGALVRLGTLQRRAIGGRVAVMADGKSFVSVRGGKYVRIWDAATGKLRQAHELPGIAASDGVLSPDGGRLLSGVNAGENHLTLWDVFAGKLLRTLPLEGVTSISQAAFSSDGKMAAAAGIIPQREYRICVWELATGKAVLSLKVREPAEPRRLLFTPDGKRLIADIDATPPHLICWDIGSGRQLWRVVDSTSDALVCTPDGKLLTSGETPVRDLATGQPVPGEKRPALKSPNDRILRLLLSPDGRTLFVSTHDKVIVWDRERGKEVRTLHGGGKRIALWPDGKSVLTNNGVLQRWDVDSGKPRYADTFALGHVGPVRAIAWSADGRRLASEAEDGTVRLWDAITGRPLHLLHHRKKLRPAGANDFSTSGDELLDLSPDGRFFLTDARGEEGIKVWDAEKGKEIRTLAFPPAEQAGRWTFQARISSDGARVIAIVGGLYLFMGNPERLPPEHQLVVWDVKTGKRQSSHAIGQAIAVGHAIAPDGRTVVSDGALIDADSGKPIAPLEGVHPQFSPSPVSFSRDGALVAGEYQLVTKKNAAVYVSRAGLRVWEAATGKMIAQVRVKKHLKHVFFHPNNRFLAAEDDEGIGLWDIAAGHLAARRPLPEKLPAAWEKPFRPLAHRSAFAPDGRLATGLSDSTILIWDLPLPARKTESLTVGELEALWTELASADAAKAWRAVWRLVDASGEVLPFLRGRVKPVPIAAAEVTDRLIADLDNDSFAVRKAARKRLHELGLQAEPALRAALKARPSLEQRRRIEELLVASTLPPPTAEELRQLRALIVLERIGTPEARRLLEAVARGAPSARPTRQAQAALAALPSPQ